MTGCALSWAEPTKAPREVDHLGPGPGRARPDGPCGGLRRPRRRRYLPTGTGRRGMINRAWSSSLSGSTIPCPARTRAPGQEGGMDPIFLNTEAYRDQTKMAELVARDAKRLFCGRAAS